MAFLTDRPDIERMRLTREMRDRFKLDRTIALMKALGDPHKEFRSVHIAGTKGKGSVATMTASCLEACGYTVGLYTSPHLVDVRERVLLNGAMMSTGEFAGLVDRVADAAKKVETRHGPCTFFELMTAVAFLRFAEQAIDIAVLEVGLGGRLDCTNVVTPEISAITAIGKDHTQILGDTTEEIAREKAGIFKKGVPAITVDQPKPVLEALRQSAEAAGAPLAVLGKDIEFSFRFEASPDLGPHRRVCVASSRTGFEHLAVPLPGEHQAHNCGLALAILDRLREKGFETPEPAVARGLARTRVPGRMELAWTKPRILLDVAHNEDSIASLIKAIGGHVPYDSMVMIFGCSADKDLDGMLAKVALGADKVIFTRATNSPRAADPKELQRRFVAMSGKMTQVAETLPDALNLAARAVSRGDLICVTGSFYIVGEAKQHLADLVARRAGGEGAD